MNLTSIVSVLNSLIRLARFVTDFTGGKSCVDGLVITNGGSGYTADFTVTFTGGGGTGASGTAIVDGGTIVDYEIIARGSNYTSTPTPDFSAGAGTGAIGAPIMAATTLDAIATVDLEVGLLAHFANASILYTYQLTAGTDAESSPDVIRPDDYATTTNEKVWKLIAASSHGLPYTFLNGRFKAVGSDVILQIKNQDTGNYVPIVLEGDDASPNWGFGDAEA